MLKTGSEHVQSLKDGRQVFINGQVVADVSEHPAFRRTVQSVGLCSTLRRGLTTLI